MIRRVTPRARRHTVFFASNGPHRVPISNQSAYDCWSLELVLCRQLQLAHGGRRAADAAEGRRTVGQIRIAPVGVIEGVECLETNRQLMLFVVGHQKLLVQRGIQVS